MPAVSPPPCPLCVPAGTEAALPLASGMAAICSTLLTLLKAGDHMLIQVGPSSGGWVGGGGVNSEEGRDGSGGQLASFDSLSHWAGTERRPAKLQSYRQLRNAA